MARGAMAVRHAGRIPAPAATRAQPRPRSSPWARGGGANTRIRPPTPQVRPAATPKAALRPHRPRTQRARAYRRPATERALPPLARAVAAAGNRSKAAARRTRRTQRPSPLARPRAIRPRGASPRSASGFARWTVTWRRAAVSAPRAGRSAAGPGLESGLAGAFRRVRRGPAAAARGRTAPAFPARAHRRRAAGGNRSNGRAAAWRSERSPLPVALSRAQPCPWRA